MSMEYRDYLDTVRSKAEDFIANEGDNYDSFESLYEVMTLEDDITGAGSNSYTMDRTRAVENVSGIIWDAVFREKLSDYGYDVPVEAEYLDVIARLIALADLYDDLSRFYDTRSEA